jgi:hypothetical protein
MDLLIKENGNGGDLVRLKNDLSVIDGLQNMPYLALFGGNLGQNTPVLREKNVQMFDFWANSLLFSENKAVQFNSLTEKALISNPLTSFGLSQIQNAVNSDLEFMRAFCKIKVVVELVSDDRVSITIYVQEPENETNLDFIFIWDATKMELVDTTQKDVTITPIYGIFDETFDYTFS